MFASPLRAVRWTLAIIVAALVCVPSALAQAAGAQLQQTKTVTDVNGGGVRPGDVLTYDITGTNTGTEAAANVVVGDGIPANTTFVAGSASIPDGTPGSAGYIPPNNAAFFFFPTVPAGANYHARFQVTVNSPLLDGTQITNVAITNWVGATSGTPGTTTSTVTSTVGSPDLAVSKSHTGDLTPGTDVTYTIAISNVGSAPTGGAFTVTEHPGPGLTAVALSGDGYACDLATLTCTSDSATPLAPGAHAPITFVAHIDDGAASGSIENSATVSGGGDGNPSNNVAGDSAQPSPRADLSVSKTIDKTHIAVGESVSFTLVVRNAGPSRARTVVVTDPVPAGLTIVGTSAGCESAAGAQLVTCQLDSLAAGAGQTFTITATATPSAAGTTQANTANVTSGTQDPVVVNNASTAAVTVDPTDLAVTKTLLTDPLLAGAPVRYRVTVSNRGLSNATNVSLTDVMVGAHDASADACTTNATGSLVCAIGNLAAGASVDIVVDATVDANATEITNTASVTGFEYEASMLNNSAVVTTPVAGADLSITKSAGVTSVDQGASITYTLSARNAGPGTARNTEITDTVPPGTTFVSAGPGCDADLVGTIVCSVGDLASGADVTRTVTVKVADDATGTLTNTAGVSSDTRDDNLDNNQAQATVTINGSDLSLTKTASATRVDQGGTVTYTLAVRNNGPGRAGDVTVTDQLPAGTTFQSASSECANAAGTVTCSLGNVAAGTTKNLTITVKMPGTGTITNTATVSSQTPDPNLANNSSSADVGVRSTDLAITKTANTDNASPGDTVTYTVSVKNGGTDTAGSVTITDPLPAGTTFVSAGAGCTNAAGTVTCPIGDVAAGATATRTITVKINANVVGTLRNTAAVASSTTDSDARNNTASADVVVSDKTDLAIVKTASTDEAAPGDTITYTLVVTNAGSRTAAGVVVNDPLPAEVTYVSASTGCTQAGRVVTCPLGTLAAGASKTVTIKVRANAITVPSATDTHTLKTATVQTAAEVLAGQTRTLTVSCAAGYIASDASVRLDDLGDVTGSKLVDVRSVQQTSDRVYTAVVRNGTTTKSTVRLEGVCLSEATTSTRSHAHEIVVTPPISAAGAIPANSRRDVTVECGPGQTVVSPSFAFSGNGSARLAASEPTTSGWKFSVESGSAATTASVSVRCLDPLTTEVSGHVHRLAISHKLTTDRVYGGRTASPNVQCPSGSSAIVGSHDLPSGVVTLGNDLDIAGRTFWGLNTTSNSQTISVDSTCVEYKTGSPTVIRTANNTATVSSTTPDRDSSNNTSTAGVTITAGDSHPSSGPVCNWWAWWLWWHRSGWSHR